MTAQSGSESAIRGIVVTGTDTGVGKTWVSAAIVRQLRRAGKNAVGVKPVCSGAETRTAGSPVWSDVKELRHASGNQFSEDEICAQRFTAPLAPGVAAAREGRRVDFGRMAAVPDEWNQRAELLVIEGVGGLLCPLTEAHTFADLAAEYGFPMIVVASNRLGTINHTLLTIETAKARGLRVIGVIVNHPKADGPFVDGNGAENSEEFLESNVEQICRFSRIPLIGICRHGADDVSLTDLSRNRSVSLAALFDVRVRKST